MSQPDPLALEVRALRQAVGELRDDLGTLLRRQLARDDRRLGLALWPLADALVGREAFTVARLAEVAMAAQSPSGRAAVELIDEACAGADSLRPFGELLVRLEGVPLAGLRLVNAGALHRTRRWRLVGGAGPL